MTMFADSAVYVRPHLYTYTSAHSNQLIQSDQLAHLPPPHSGSKHRPHLCTTKHIKLRVTMTRT